ncbi:hypothetical protein BH11PLA2_BH11PLA2_06790 [soil metagenome]
MLDFQNAKRVAREKWLSAFDDKLGGPQVICDADCAEYEWGWLIAWGPTFPDQVPPDGGVFRWPVLVDRMNGNLQNVSTAGVRIAIMKLLERRLPEILSHGLSIKELTRETISLRAFIPLSKLQDGNLETSDFLEVFRLTNRK